MTGLVFQGEDFGWGYRMHYGPASAWGRSDRQYMRVIGYPYQSRDEALQAMNRLWTDLRTRAEREAAALKRLNAAFKG